MELVSKVSPSATTKMQSDISKGCEKMCGCSRHSLQNFRDERRKIQTLSEARGRGQIPERSPVGTKFSDVARLFVVRSFVPARWKCWPATKLRNSRESVAEGRVDGSSKEQNREKGRDRRTRYEVDDEGGAGRCLDSVENMEGVRERVLDGSASK